MFRHVIQYMKGEEFDKETKLSHLAHATTNLLFLTYLVNKEKEK